jgi:DNA polymerase-3 subunit gamma/tau
VGKTSVARILAKSVNCQEGPVPAPCNQCQSCKEITAGVSIDVLEIDGASNTGVDDVREIRDNVQYAPSASRYKVYIIDEVHMLSTSAFNALLKTLEEPPSHVMFIFATTEPHKIPPTVISRCQRFDFRRIPFNDILSHLVHIAGEEEISISEESLHLIAKEADGSLRDSQSLLDRIISFAGNTVADDQVVAILGAIERNLLYEASEAIVNKDVRKCLDLIDSLYTQGYDLTQFYHAFLEHLRNLLVAKLSREPARLIHVPDAELAELERQAKEVEAEDLHRYFRLLFAAEEEIARSSSPRVALEVCFLRMVQMKSLASLQSLIAQLNELGRGEEVREPTREEPRMAEEEVAIAPPPPPEEDAPPGEEEAAREKPQREEPTSKDDVWKELLTFAREKKPLLASMLEHGTLVKLSDRELDIAFPSGSFFLDKIREGANEKLLREICAEFFDRPVEFVVSASEDLHKARQLKQKEKNDGGGIEKEALTHPRVQEALEALGGKIVEIKPSR